MNTRDNIKLISKLNRDTKEDIIKWKFNDERINSIVGTEIVLNNSYVVKILNKILRIYKFKEKIYYDEDAYNWTENYKLEFIDNYGNSEFTFPEDRAIYDLYETVQYKTSGIENFLTEYLTDED